MGLRATTILLLSASLARPSHAQVATVGREGQAGVAARSAVLDLSTGVSRHLTNDGLPTRAPRWSPDGALIAVQTLKDSAWNVTIVNPDASNRRMLPIPTSLINVQTAWSPGGKRLAVRTGSEVWTVDVRTGASERLGPVLHPHHLAWRDDTSLIVARVHTDSAKRRVWWLSEEHVHGGERLLRNVSEEFPDSTPRGLSGAGYFIGPNAYVLLNPRRVIVNPYGTNTPLPGEGQRIGAPGTTPDGKFLLLGVGTDTAPIRSLELIDVARRTSTIVALPFLARTAGYSRPALLPDHSMAIVLGRADANAPWAFYEVRLSSGASRPVTIIPGDPQLYHFDLSPDGRRVVYTYDAPARPHN